MKITVPTLEDFTALFKPLSTSQKLKKWKVKKVKKRWNTADHPIVTLIIMLIAIGFIIALGMWAFSSVAP